MPNQATQNKCCSYAFPNIAKVAKREEKKEQRVWVDGPDKKCAKAKKSKEPSLAHSSKHCTEGEIVIKIRKKEEKK